MHLPARGGPFYGRKFMTTRHFYVAKTLELIPRIVNVTATTTTSS